MNMNETIPTPTPRKSGWTDARRAAQAAMLRELRPWDRSTGPRTKAGKARSSRNACKNAGWDEAITALRRQKARFDTLLSVFRLARTHRLFLRKKFLPVMIGIVNYKRFERPRKISKNELLAIALRRRLIHWPDRKRLQRLIRKALFVGGMPGFKG